MTPEHPNGPEPTAGDWQARNPESADAYRLCLFATDSFPGSVEAVRRSLFQPEPADADIAIARLERALREAPEIEDALRWARPERLNRGLRLCLERDGADDAVAEIEQIARRLGLAVLDEDLDEISFPCRLGERQHMETAARALCEAGGGYLMIEGGPGDRYFVQAFAQSGSCELRLEAVGNRGLSSSRRFGRAHAAELRRRGWRPPRGAELNHSRTAPIAGPEAPRRLAALLCDALESAYALAKTASVTICLAID